MKVTIEKVERLMDRADVGYEVAKEALDASDGDLLEAIILLEKEGKFGPGAGHSKPAEYSTSVTSDPSAIGQSYGSDMYMQTHVDPNFTYGGGTKTRAGRKNKNRRSGNANSGGNESYGQYYGPYQYKDETTEFEDGFKRFIYFIGRVIRGGIINYFEVWRKGERVIYFPVILFLFCLIPWVFWLALALIIVGLFCGCRYRFSGPHLGRKDVNDAMDKATDFAEEIKDGESPNN